MEEDAQSGSYSAPADLDAIDHPEEERSDADVDSRRILGDIGRQQSIQTTGLVSWIRIWFTMPDADISEHCGDDALQYLRFQRYIIAYLAIIVVTCICIVLPINFQGVVQVRQPQRRSLFTFDSCNMLQPFSLLRART